MKEIEYPDAPSGFVTLYNYKEPFMPYVGGYGYEGVLLFDGEKDTVQCHFCGEWFTWLPHHLHKEHVMTAKQYKTEVGLNQTTALIGEKARAILIASGLEARKKNLKPGGFIRSEEVRKKISETLKNTNREKQNKRGTCPEQLLDGLRKKYDELGHTPTALEIGSGRKETIIKVWGSWKRACEMAGIPYREPSKGRVNGNRTRYTEEEIVAWIVKYFDEHNKLPTPYNLSKQAKRYKIVKKIGWKKLCRKAVVSGGKYRRVSLFRHSKDDLISLLREFAKQNGRNPSTSDCKRKLLPNASKFIYHFGSWSKTLKAAGL